MIISVAILVGIALAGVAALNVCRSSDRSARSKHLRATLARRTAATVAFAVVGGWGAILAIQYAFSDVSSSTDGLAVIFLPLYAFAAAVGADAFVKSIQNRASRAPN